MDNVFIEQLWRSIKYENIYLNDYASASNLRHGLNRYFQYYNYERTHQSLGNLTPAEIYNDDDMKKAA